MEESIDTMVTPIPSEEYAEIYSQYTPLANLPKEKETGAGVMMAIAAGAIAVSAIIAWVGAVMTRKAARTILGTKSAAHGLTRGFDRK